MSGKEGQYDVFSSTELILYRISGSAATLCVGMALRIGYRKAYFTDVILGSLCLCLTLRLKEVQAENHGGTSWQRVKSCVWESARFLRSGRQAAQLIIMNAAVGAVATLLAFFMQARLPACGLPRKALGPVLFAMGLGGAVGARAVLLVRKWRYGKVAACCAAGITLCLLGSLSKLPLLMAVCGFLAAALDDLLQVRSDIQLNQMVPSGQRATLLSVSSLCFSMIMVLLSPALGALFSLV